MLSKYKVTMLSNVNIYIVRYLSIETKRLRNTPCHHHVLIFHMKTDKTEILLLWVFSTRAFIEVGVLKTVINVTGRIVFETFPRAIVKCKKVTCKIQFNLITIEKISSISNTPNFLEMIRKLNIKHKNLKLKTKIL